MTCCVSSNLSLSHFQEEEPLSLTSQQQQQQQEYVTPSWSLSPSSSPISHSDASDSDAGDEDNGSPRGRAQRRRKKRRGAHSKKKTPYRTPPLVTPTGIPLHNCPLPLSHPAAKSSPPCSSSSSSSSSSSAKSVFKAPAPLGSNTTGNVGLNIPRGAVSIDSMRQTCEHCGRHFRSLGRHLDKHHAHQPNVCSALVESYTQMPRLHAHSPTLATAHALTLTLQHSLASQAAGQGPGSDLTQLGVQDLSMAPPNLTAANQSPASAGRNPTLPGLTPPRGQNAVPVSVLKRSPPPVCAAQSRRLKTERPGEEEDEEDEDDVEVVEVKRPKEEEEDVEVVCPQLFSNMLAKEMELPKMEENEEEEEEEDEENGVMEVEDESGAEDKEKDLLR